MDESCAKCLELESSVISLKLISMLTESFVLLLIYSRLLYKSLTDVGYRMTSACTKCDKGEVH